MTYERARELRQLHIELDTQVCATCERFRQHYCKDGTLIYSGHCCYPRIKPRNVWDTCEHFKNKEDT